MMDLASKLIPERIMFLAFVMEYYLKAGIIFAIFAFQHYTFAKSNDILRSWLTAPPSFTPLLILNMLEYIWNLQFIKDTRNQSPIQFTSNYRTWSMPATATRTANAATLSVSLAGTVVAYLEGRLSMHFLQYRTVSWTVFAVFQRRKERTARFGILLSLGLPEVMRMPINHSLRFLTATLLENAGDCSTKVPSFTEWTPLSVTLDYFFTSLSILFASSSHYFSQSTSKSP